MDSHAGPSGSQEGHQARSSNRSKQPKEIFVSVETYVSSKTAKVTAKVCNLFLLHYALVSRVETIFIEPLIAKQDR